MTRWLTIIAILVVLGFVGIIVWSDSGSSRPADGDSAAGQETAAAPASFRVLVGGEEVQAPEPGAARRIADMPLSQLNPSLISQVRAVGNTRILVFTDGSELIVDRFILDQLPAEVVYRAGYDRDR